MVPFSASALNHTASTELKMGEAGLVLTISVPGIGPASVTSPWPLAPKSPPAQIEPGHSVEVTDEHPGRGQSFQKGAPVSVPIDNGDSPAASRSMPTTL